MAGKPMSKEDQEFLEQCKEEFKDRFTEKDEDFMKVFNAEPPKPPIIEEVWTPNNPRWGNNRRNNRRHHPYRQYGDRSSQRDYYMNNRQRR